MALIEQQKALDAIEKCHKRCCRTDSNGDEWIHYETTLNEIESIKPKPEVIHCKDCKRFRKPSSIVNADWGWCNGWPTPLTTFVKVYGFCHRAERRGEAE